MNKFSQTQKARINRVFVKVRKSALDIEEKVQTKDEIATLDSFNIQLARVRSLVMEAPVSEPKEKKVEGKKK